MTTVCSEECRVQTLSAGRAREQKRSIPIQQQCPPQQRYIPQTALTAATTTTKTTTTTTRENFHDKYPCIVLVYYSLQHVFIPLQYLSMCVCFFLHLRAFLWRPWVVCRALGCGARRGPTCTPRRKFGSRAGSVARALGVQRREIWQVSRGCFPRS